MKEYGGKDIAAFFFISLRREKERFLEIDTSKPGIARFCVEELFIELSRASERNRLFTPANQMSRGSPPDVT